MYVCKYIYTFMYMHIDRYFTSLQGGMHATTCVNFPNSGSSRLNCALCRSLRSHLDLCCLQFATVWTNTRIFYLWVTTKKMWQWRIFNKKNREKNGSNDPIMDKILYKISMLFWHHHFDTSFVNPDSWRTSWTCCSRRWRSRHGLPSVETHGRRNRSLGPGGKN